MMPVLAEAPPGGHELVSVCGYGYVDLIVVKFYYCAFTVDTLISSGVAIAATLAIAFLIARSVRPRVPGKGQMVLEFLLGYTESLVKETVGGHALFVVPLAATLGLYILVGNWISFLPLKPPIFPTNADLNQTLALALVVFFSFEVYSIRRLGFRGFLVRFTKPFDMHVAVRVPFVLLNVIEEIVKPVTLSLRLFGNIFAGVLMLFLLTTLIPFLVSVPLVIVWKSFDVFFVGTIQAFIFMLLTIIYFGQAQEGPEQEHGHQDAPAGRQAAPTSSTRIQEDAA